jgi:hypothetical protein
VRLNLQVCKSLLSLKQIGLSTIFWFCLQLLTCGYIRFTTVQARLSLLDRRRRIHLEVVLIRRWVIWVLGIWKGRVWGKGGSRGVSLQATWDRGGRTLSQLGGFQVSRRGQKGGQRGQQGERKSKGMRHVHCNPCCVHNECLERLNDTSCVYA